MTFQGRCKNSQARCKTISGSPQNPAMTEVLAETMHTVQLCLIMDHSHGGNVSFWYRVYNIIPTSSSFEAAAGEMELLGDILGLGGGLGGFRGNC